MSVNIAKSVLYMNIHILDASEAIKRKVKKKVDNSHLPFPFKSLAKRAAPAMISNMMTTARLGKKVSTKLVRKLPAKMKEKGITAVAEEVYREGPYAVFQLQIQHVDALRLAGSREALDEIQVKEGVEYKGTTPVAFIIALIQWFFGLIGIVRQRDIEDDYLPALVQSYLDLAMSEILIERMEKRRLKTETMVLPEAKQARYFYAKLAELQPPAKRSKRHTSGANDTLDNMSDSSSSSSASSSSAEEMIVEEVAVKKLK
jgi:hypothetical protein